MVTNPNITIDGIWPVPDSMPQKVLDAVLKEPTYLVLNQKQTVPLGWNLTLVGQYEKGKRADQFMRLYKIEPPLPAVL